MQTRKKRIKTNRLVTPIYQQLSASEDAKGFVKKIIGPLYNHLSNTRITMMDLIDLFLGVNYRSVRFAKAKEMISIPTVIRLTEGGKQVPGTPNLRIYKNQVLLFVEDARDPYVKVEIVFDGKEINYLLTKAQFSLLRDNIDVY